MRSIPPRLPPWRASVSRTHRTTWCAWTSGCPTRTVARSADDYLVKPFSFAELAARVRALARRQTINGGATIRLGSLGLDAARHEAHRNDQRLDLTPKEFALLRYLMLHPSEVLTPERLLEHVWDDRADPFTNTVRVTISNLRRKLSEAGPGQPIETVVGVGYRLVEGVE